MASMFKQKPSEGLRAAAEAKNAPGNFPSEIPYDYEAGVPKEFSGGRYVDGPNASDARPPSAYAGSKPSSPDVYEPKPLANLRKK